MGNDDTSSSVLPWLWVIEYLASFKQVKASLLHAVLEVAPELPDNLGKDMREVVYLRCLEELCDPRIEMPNKGSLEDTVSKLDLSMSCEEVLASIFCHDSVSDLKEAEKKLWKWDIGSFLEHKRPFMPLTALQRLNLKITEGAPLQGSPRKDILGLASCYTRGGASAERNKLGLDTNGRNIGDHERVTGNLVPMPMEQRDNLMKECDDIRISTHAKRSRTDPAMENLEESLEYRQHSNGRSPDDYSIAKKLKLCQPSYLGASDPTIVRDSFDSLPKESAKSEEDRVRTSEEGEILGGRAENSVDTNDLPGKIDDMLTEMVKINESSSMSLNKEMESQQTECIPSRHDAEKISCNTNLHLDVAEHDREKLEFSNRARKQHVCMKCGEGGQLMVCHNSTCHLVFHENCVGFSAPFDADGNIYCPKCSVSTTKMEYRHSAKEAFMARQDNALFLDLIIHQIDRLDKVSEQHQSILDRDEIVEECENVHRKCRTGSVPDGYGDNSVQVCNNNKKGTESGDKEKSEPSPRVCSEKKKKDILLRQGSEEKENSDTDKTDNKNSMLNFRSLDVATNQQGKPADNLVDQVNDAPSPKLSAKGTLENANKESYCFRGRGNKEVFTMPLHWRTRQKKADWTVDEEMILKTDIMASQPETSGCIDEKDISGLCTILVATIQEVKDRISQIEYIFCRQLFPDFSKSRKHEVAWKEHESDLLLQIERFKLERQQAVIEGQFLQKELVQLAKEKEEVVEELNRKLNCLQLQVNNLQHDLKRKIEEIKEGIHNQDELLQLVKSNGASSKDRLRQLTGHKEEQPLLAKHKCLEAAIVGLLEDLRKKDAEVPRGNQFHANPSKNLSGSKGPYKEKWLIDSQRRYELIPVRSRASKVDVCAEEKEKAKDAGSSEKRLPGNIVEPCADIEMPTTLLRLKEVERQLPPFGVQCSDLDLNEEDKHKHCQQLVLLFERKRMEARNAYKQLKSQYNFLCKKVGLSYGDSGVLKKFILEDSFPSLQWKDVMMTARKASKHSPNGVHCGIGVKEENVYEDYIAREDGKEHGAIDNSSSLLHGFSKIVKSTFQDVVKEGHLTNDGDDTEVEDTSSPTPDFSQEFPSGNVNTTGKKRAASSWRGTRSNQNVRGPDPHDDFLDTPFENIRENLNKAGKCGGSSSSVHESREGVIGLNDGSKGLVANLSHEKQQRPVSSSEDRGFKFVAPARRKDEREHLKGMECRQCKKFFDALSDRESKDDVMLHCEHNDGISKHRYHYVPPLTPEGFWRIGFESET